MKRFQREKVRAVPQAEFCSEGAVAYPDAGSCRRMPCRTGISGGPSSRRVGLSRPLLGSVGVKIRVKGRSQIGSFQYTGMSPAITRSHVGSPSVCPLLVGEILPYTWVERYAAVAGKMTRPRTKG